MENIGKKTVKGASWNVFSGVINQLIQLIIGIILARLLTPKDFGLVAMVMIIAGFANMIQDMGFNMAVIQKKDIRNDHFNAVFWFNTGLGILLTVLLIAITPLISNFYKEPNILTIMPWLALNYTITSIGMLQRTKLRKELRYKILSQILMVSSFTAGGIAVGLAYFGFGVWALVAHQLLIQGLSTLAFWIFSGWTPSKPINIKQPLSELWDYSKFSFGNKSLLYWSKKMDSILVGKFIGASQLGIYNKAYRFLNLPSQVITNQIANVVLSSFSQLQDDLEKIKRGYLKMTAINSVVVVPIIVAFAFFSSDFVYALLGNKWEKMIVILQIFAAGSIPVCFFYPGTVFNALGKVKKLFQLNLIMKALTILLIVLALQWTVVEVAIAVSVGTFLDYIVQQYFVNKYLKINWWELIAGPIQTLILAIISSLIVYLLFEYFHPIHDSIFYYGLKLIASSLLYLVVLIIVRPKNYLTCLDFIESFKPKLAKKIGIK